MTAAQKRKFKNALGALQTRREEIKAKMESGQHISEAEQEEFETNVKQAKFILSQINGDEIDTFVATSGSGVPPEVTGGMGAAATRGPRASDYFDSAGDLFQAIAAASAPAGTPVGQYHGGMVPENLRDFQAAATGGSIGVPSDGGFLVGEELSGELLKSAFETGLLASRVRRRTLGPNANRFKANAYDETSRADGSRYGGILSYWKGEAAELTGSKPKFRQIDLELKKLTGLYYATDELLQDAPALDAEIRDAFASEFGFQIDNVILRGDGSGKPLGILNSPSLVQADKETSQETKTIVTSNLTSMYARWIGARRNGVWLTNRDTFPELATLSLPVGTGGSAMGLLGGSVSNDPNQRLLNMTLLEMEQAASLGSLGDLMLIDPSQYLWIDKGGIQSAVSIHVKFVEDEVVFRFIYRCDGQPIPASPILPFKGSDTRSPFVALQAR